MIGFPPLKPDMGPRETRIRPFGPADRPFFRTSLARYIRGGVRLDPLRRKRASTALIARYERFLEKAATSGDRVILIAEQSRRRVGFVIGFRRELSGFAGAAVGRFRHPCEITELYVDPRSRRAGVGGQLMREMERRCASCGCDWVGLSVAADNRSARALYKSLGYRDREIEMGKPLGVGGPRLRTA